MGKGRKIWLCHSAEACGGETGLERANHIGRGSTEGAARIGPTSEVPDITDTRHNLSRTRSVQAAGSVGFIAQRMTAIARGCGAWPAAGCAGPAGARVGI